MAFFAVAFFAVAFFAVAFFAVAFWATAFFAAAFLAAVFLAAVFSVAVLLVAVFLAAVPLAGAFFATDFPDATRSGGVTMPPETTSFTASSTDIFMNTMSLRGQNSKKPEVGFGVVGIKTFTISVLMRR